MRRELEHQVFRQYQIGVLSTCFSIKSRQKPVPASLTNALNFSKHPLHQVFRKAAKCGVKSFDRALCALTGGD